MPSHTTTLPYHSLLLFLIFLCEGNDITSANVMGVSMFLCNTMIIALFCPFLLPILMRFLTKWCPMLQCLMWCLVEWHHHYSYLAKNNNLVRYCEVFYHVDWHFKVFLANSVVLLAPISLSLCYIHNKSQLYQIYWMQGRWYCCRLHHYNWVSWEIGSCFFLFIF